jgi:hypothetical protein
MVFFDDLLIPAGEAEEEEEGGWDKTERGLGPIYCTCSSLDFSTELVGQLYDIHVDLEM